jgi:ribonucleotide reductase alpha subunit
MTAQELAQKILDRIKDADEQVENKPEPFWRVAYPLVIDDIERLCKEQLAKELEKK